MNAGSCTFHHGNTLHYTRGNSTDTQRRAFIINCRPIVSIWTVVEVRCFTLLGLISRLLLFLPVAHQSSR